MVQYLCDKSYRQPLVDGDRSILVQTGWGGLYLYRIFILYSISFSSKQ